MARQVNRLVARTLSSLPPGMHADGNGLYLKVRPSGSRSWVYVYSKDNRRYDRGLGPLNRVTLSEARALAREMQQQVHAPPKAGEASFGAVAEQLIESLRPGWRNAKHAAQWTSTLTTHAAAVWSRPVDDLDTDDVLAVLSPIWTKLPETASRVRSRMERVFDAAKVRGLRTRDNPARWGGHLAMLLPARKITSRKHHPAMPYTMVPAFMVELREKKALSGWALEFLILTAARTGEVIKADWSEFDLHKRLWVIPPERMKMSREHRVPLVPRAVEILEHVKFLGGSQPFKMSNMSMDMLLRRMDYDDYTIHGFRSSFRDWVGEETDFPAELAEAALAHQVGNAVERAYRRGDALEKRRAMMEEWGAYLGN